MRNGYGSPAYRANRCVRFWLIEDSDKFKGDRYCMMCTSCLFMLVLVVGCAAFYSGPVDGYKRVLNES